MPETRDEPIAYASLGHALRDGGASVLSGASLAALHLGLQLDAFPPELVPTVARVVMAQLGAPTRGAPLSLRLRLVNACRAIAVATRVGAEDLRADDLETAGILLSALVRDRDPAVATPAAAAMGALAVRSPRITAFLGAASSPAEKRRVVSATVVQWVLGDRSESSLARVLSGVDNFGTAEAIRALTAWRSSAPHTIDAAITGLAADGAPAEVHAAATAYAWSIDDRAARQHLLAELRTSARPGDNGFALWVEKRAERAWSLLEQASELRVLARAGNAAAAARDTFDAVNETVEWMREAESGAAVDAAEDALDLAFVASTLVSDALLATSADGDEGAARWRAWAQTMAKLREHRIGALDRAGRDRVELREAARKLGRSLDATPKAIQREAKGKASPSAVLRDIHERLTKNKEALLDRSLARLFALAIEVAPGDMPKGDALALMLPSPRKVLRHFAKTFALEGLETIIDGLLALGEVIDEVMKASLTSAPPRRLSRRLAASLDSRLRELERATATLADSPLARGLDYLVRGCSEVLHDQRLCEAIDVVLERGVDGVTRAVHDALARYEMTRSPGAGTLSGAKRLRHLLVPAADPSSQRGDGARMLPAALEGLLEAVITLQGALDPEAKGPPPGTIIGDYVVVKMLGSGGMGACALAKPRSVRTALPVVLKLPRRTTGIHRLLFRQEALALLQLAEAPHPGIVKFVAFNDGAGVPPHLVMELIDGISLEQRLTRAPLALAEALPVFAQLTRAVAHAHSYRIGHYDIKPANVMLAKRLGGAPVLVDWGIAGGTFRANTGTPEYMGPERYEAHGEDGTSLASDVYALACLFSEISSREVLLGAPITAADERVTPGVLEAYERLGDGAYRTMLVAQLVATNAKVRRARVERSLAAAPPPIVELVLQMLAEAPAERPTAASVAQRLETFLFKAEGFAAASRP